jgi:RIO kinase 2
VDTKDITLLRVVDGLWETYEWVPVGEVERRVSSRINLKKKVRELEKKKLLSWKPHCFGDEPCVKITERGLDTLAVWDFVKHGVLDDIGHKIGEGKESVIVLGLKGDEKRAIKFHRYHSAEFKNIRRSLAYSSIRWWKKLKGRLLRPVDFPRAKAQVEYHTLKKLHGKVAVPKSYGINRHVIVMEFIGEKMPAPLMSKVKKEPWMKIEVLENYEKALKEGIVHGDLSPFNVMVWDKLYLIDWPQAVPVGFEGAEELMKRDKGNFSA